jgi:hypothetical protein
MGRIKDEMGSSCCTLRMMMSSMMRCLPNTSLKREARTARVESGKMLKSVSISQSSRTKIIC